MKKRLRGLLALAVLAAVWNPPGKLSAQDEGGGPFRERLRARIRQRIAERRAAQAASPADEEERSLEVGGLQRSYLLHLPPGFAPSKAWPLVLVLHGGGGTKEGAVRMSDMSSKADKEGFIAAYPGGTGRGSHLTWNSWNCCGYALKTGADDVGFISALIDKLVAEEHVDPKRVYVTGLSNGALLTYKLACELSDKIAAAAPVAGAVNGDCRPQRPVPLIIFHGTADEHVPYEGGYGKKSFVKHEDKPVSYAVSLWAKANGCAAAPQKREFGSIVQESYGSCRSGADVVLYTVKGQGHAWPGGKKGARNGNVDPPTEEISATDLMWDFFALHPR